MSQIGKLVEVVRVKLSDSALPLRTESDLTHVGGGARRHVRTRFEIPTEAETARFVTGLRRYDLQGR
jgi:hypothetical protein